MPIRLAPVALALRAVHSRAVWPWAGVFSVWIANAKSTPVNCRPVASLLPPLMPANALRPLPPRVSCSTVTALVDSFTFVVLAKSPSFTLPVLLLSAKAPETRKKPKASTVILPEARVSSPRLPLMSSNRLLLVPVLTLKLVLPVL